MKNYIIILSFFISIAAVSCDSSEHKDHNTADTTTTKAAKKYTCPMDADIISDKPGTCPKCKMELVVKS